MSRHVTWRELAEEAINGNWGGSYTDRADAMRSKLQNAQHNLIIIALLADIARSLRVLQCPNFQSIPRVLGGIRRHTGRIPTEKKRRKTK